MNDWTNIAFYVFMGITLISGLAIAFTKNLLYAALALMMTFLGLAAIYIFLGAEFVAITQILVYVGGILILLVFGIMLTNKKGNSKVVSTTYNKLLSLIAAGAFFYLLFKGIIQASFEASSWIKTNDVKASEINDLGMSLMTDYVMIFEIIGILLLVALIAAIRISANARKEVEADA